MSIQLTSEHATWAAQFCDMPELAAPGSDQPDVPDNQTDTTTPQAAGAAAAPGTASPGTASPGTDAGSSSQSSGPSTTAPVPSGDVANGQPSQASDPNAASPPPDNASATPGAPPPGGPAPGGPANTGGDPAAAPIANGQAPPPSDINSPARDATDKVVYFSRDSAALTPKDEKALSDYADRYIQAANPTQIVIGAYASVDGDAGRNQTLSQQRADAVKKYLSDTKGIKPELITATGHGVRASKDNLAAPNRCAEFGPPVQAAAQPQPRQPAQQPPAQQPPAQPQKVSTTAQPVPPVPCSDDQFTKIFGADVLTQWNAYRSKGGPVPPSRQLSVTLTLKGMLFGPSDDSKAAVKVNWLGEPSIAVVFNSSGPAANDQEAITLFKLHWDNKLLGRPVELSVLGVGQNLFTSGQSPQGGLQPQVKVPVGKDGFTKNISVVVGGSFMVGKDSSGNLGLNSSGFLGVDVTAF